MSEPATSPVGQRVPVTRARRIPTRYWVLTLIFVITTLNYADRRAS